MHDCLEPPERGVVGEHAVAQNRPVDGAVPHRAGERRPDIGHRAAALGKQLVHRGVGIVDRHAETTEHPGGGGLAHSDGPGEPDDHHRRQPVESAATCLRSASSTTGSSPYQPAKPGRAW